MNQKLSKSEIENEIKLVEGWFFDEKSSCLYKEYVFKSYLKNIAFVNAIAWLANKENHHPDLEISFNRCLIKISTHDLGGVTKNDLRLARLINEL